MSSGARAGTVVGAEPATRALAAHDFVCIASGGFGDPENNRVQTMAWFRDRLYIGITRHRTSRGSEAGALGGATRRSLGPGMSDRASYVDQPGQIWRYDPASERWDQVLRSPRVRLTDGRQGFRDVGYRKMVVMQGPSDPAPTLYLSTISIFGSLILRSDDGERFLPASQPTLEKRNTWSYRALVGWKDRLFTSPAGRILGGVIERNAAETPIILENPDPAVAPWVPANEPGFGDPTNRTVYEMGTLGGQLYAGTYNPTRGFQIWRTETDDPPYAWRQIIGDGASRGSTNQAVTNMCVFRGAMYVGTGQQGSHADQSGRGASGAAEIIRVHADDTWDLIVGDQRLTFDGLKSPLSGLGPGFGDRYNGIIWKMTEHAGWLYAGTVNTVSFIDVFGRSDLARRTPRLANAVRQFLERKGGFEVWRSRNGVAWEPVTRTGFGNPMSFGIESMLSTPIGLVIGTLGMTRGTPEWPGGCSVWLGRAGK